MSYSMTVRTKRFDKDGSIHETDDMIIEFSSEGMIEQVEIYNETFQDWIIVELHKLNAYKHSKLQALVDNELNSIRSFMADRDYATDWNNT